MENRNNDFAVLGRIEMKNLLGGEPAPSTMPTEHHGNTDVLWGLFQKYDNLGDSYPDDCCE